MRRKLYFSLILAALVPGIAALYLAHDLLERSLSMGLNADVESALDVMKKLTAWIKEERQALLASVLKWELQRPEIAAELAAGNCAALRSSVQSYVSGRAAIVDLTCVVGMSAEGMPSSTELPSGPGIDPAALSQLTWTLPLPGQHEFAHIRMVLQERGDRAHEVARAWQSLQAYAHARTARTQLISRMLQYFGILFVVALIMSVLLASGISQGLIRRLNRLVEGTSRVAAGDLSHGEVPATANDELGRLEQAFARMTTTLRENQAQIRSLERMAAWREVARKLAHEIKNPLTPIVLIVQELRAKCPGGDPQFRRLLDSSIEIISEEVAGLRRLVDDFSTVGKALDPKCARLDLAQMWSEMAKGLLAAHSRLLIHPSHLPGGLYIQADRTLLKRAFANLIDNAGRASLPEQQVEVAVDFDRGRGVVQWHVRDRGTGIDPRTLPHIFEPYFTTRDDGTGLGLAIVQKIVTSHGGDVDVVSKPNEGSHFTIVLPLEMDAP